MREAARDSTAPSLEAGAQGMLSLPDEITHSLELTAPY